MALTVTTDAGLTGYAGPTQQAVAINIGNRQAVPVSYAAHCVYETSLCIPIGTGRVFQFHEVAGADVTAATEITFSLWESVTGSSLLTKTLTGGGVTVTGNSTFEASITKAESEALTAGAIRLEVWINNSGDRAPVGVGVATVSDTDECLQSISLCMPQAADRAFVFSDPDGDLSDATEITFRVWEEEGGALLISRALSATTITIANDTSFLADITGAQSEAISSGVKYAEVWVNTATDERLAGKGDFEVIDTRNHD